MNIEKSFYSLIGCAAAAGIIQQSYGMKNSYMVFLTGVLWCGCIVVHILTEKKQRQDSALLEEKNNELIRQMRIIQENQRKCMVELDGFVRAELSNIYERMDKSNKTLDNVLCTEKETIQSIQRIDRNTTAAYEVFGQVKDNTDTANSILSNILSHNEKVCQRTEHMDEEIVKVQQSVQEATNTVQGMLSNIQTGIDGLKRPLNEIKTESKNSNDKMDELKRAIFDSQDDIVNLMKEILGALQNNMNRQSDIVGQYDLLLSKVNDEILVKLINDSNNMLQLLMDCYKMLEINRRGRK